ncbi:MAG: tetratricopeptide repeat protein [Oligoflexus sp.]|nr:tetratricopeptide repeat protein [Pseudopedobacter sp.]
MKLYQNLIFVLLVFCSCKKETNKPNLSNENLIYTTAFQFRESGKTDSAFYYFNQAKDAFLINRDSFMAGKCLVNMAIIATAHGDSFGGQELSLDALPYFKTDSFSHHVYLQSNYNNLGISSNQLKEYKKAIEFYQKCLEFATDSLTILVVQNNIANAYQRNKDYKEALHIFTQILKKEILPLDYARVLSNYAYTKWLQNPKQNIASSLFKALNIRKQQKDLWGQCASYGYLSDYYQKSKPDSALFFTKKMYVLAGKMNLPDDRLEALKKLVKLSKADSSKIYFELYQNVNDSLKTARSRDKNQFALIRYETEKHKADNLKLQKENNYRNGYIGCLLFLLITGSLGTFFWYKKRKERLRLEAEKAIRESQLKTSKKVHDVVANGLYRLMSAMENNVKLNQEKLLDDMEILYEKSRDISYEDSRYNNANTNFKELVKDLLSSFATENKKIIISGNDASLWENLTPIIKHELHQVLLEIMVNMKKHSNANQIVLRFTKDNDVFKIYYKDNGKGLPVHHKIGNGFRNTGNRINEIGGNINFVNGKNGGLEITIQFPLSS